MLQYLTIFSLLIFSDHLHSKTTDSLYRVQQAQVQKHLEQNQAFVSSKVHTSKNKSQQTFTIIISGLHNNSCQNTFRYLSRYESYENYLNFVKKSSYDTQTQRVNFQLSSFILPFDMVLNFKIPRITDVGTYHFIFDNGFLKNLKGKVTVEKFNHKKNKFKCFIAINAEWTGPKTKIPDSIFELFTATIGRIGIETLFKISGHHY